MDVAAARQSRQPELTFAELFTPFRRWFNMRPLVHVALSVVALATSSLSAWSLDRDAATGQQIAERACGSCHDVNSSLARDYMGRRAPGFGEIANAPHYSTARLLRIIMVPPHKEMPSVALTEAERRELVAYIQSLRAQAH